MTTTPSVGGPGLGDTPVSSTSTASQRSSTPSKPITTTTSSSSQRLSRTPSAAAVPSNFANQPASSTTSAAAIAGQSQSNGVSTGALAGAVVGSVVAVALLALLAIWFLRKRWKGSASSQRRYRDGEEGTSSKSLMAAGEKRKASSNQSGLGWQAYLPQSADDRTIQNSVKSLLNGVELHVDNYYRKANVQLDDGIRQALSRIESGKLPVNIYELMLDQRVALSVIKHCVAYLLIKRITPAVDGSATTSLLPPNLSMAPTNLHNSSISSGESSAMQRAYSQWKSISAYLYSQAEGNSAHTARRDMVADEVDDLISAAFSAWESPVGESGALLQHRKSLVALSQKTGILIMSQPSMYEFKWTEGNEGGANRSLVTLPGFWKTSDDKGRTLEQPQLLADAFIVRV